MNFKPITKDIPEVSTFSEETPPAGHDFHFFFASDYIITCYNYAPYILVMYSIFACKLSTTCRSIMQRLEPLKEAHQTVGRRSM